MENNKYYTPTIEEFHVGFEFEKYDDRTATYKENNYIPTNWHKFKYDLQSIRLSQLGTHLYYKTIRVKYLDKEDIEECGWKLNNTKDWWELGNLFPKESYKEGDHYLGNWKYRISLNSSKSNWYHIDTRNPMNGGQLQIFRGVIKNKSELKKLMKQLGINE